MWFKAQITNIDDTVETVTLEADTLDQARQSLVADHPTLKHMIVVYYTPPSE